MFFSDCNVADAPDYAKKKLLDICKDLPTGAGWRKGLLLFLLEKRIII